jgi:hypothetical protein
LTENPADNNAVKEKTLEKEINNEEKQDNLEKETSQLMEG